jgi:hypothetical protein
MINNAIKDDLTLDFLRGNVKSTKNKTYKYLDGNKELVDVSYAEYDTNKNRTLRILYDTDGSQRLKQVSRFNQKGQKINFVNYDKYNEQDSSGRLEYNTSGFLSARYYQGTCEEQYQTDNNGRIISTIYPNTGSKEIFEYENNLIVKQLSIKGENSMFGSLFGGPSKKLTVFSNEPNGNVIEIKIYDYENKNLLATQTFSYNEFGDEIESNFIQKDGISKQVSKHAYTYDEKKNWITKINFNPDDTINSEEQREIEYFDTESNSNERNDFEYKMQTFNGQQLALLYIAFSDKLFPVSNSGEILYDRNKDGTLNLYFQKEYYRILLKGVNNLYDQGKFAQSNAEGEWNEIRTLILHAKDVAKINKENLKIYP